MDTRKVKNLAWSWHSFVELEPRVLYAILELRSRIFVVEQNCVFLDMDGADADCEHLCGFDGQQRLMVYLRLVPPGVKFPEASIGRLVSDPSVRRDGMARDACLRGIERIRQRYPGTPIRIGGQRYMERFYASLGFVSTGQPYLEDGIPHVEMLLSP